MAEINGLRRFLQIRWAKLYGSRALGRERPGSDIDLAFSAPVDCSASLAGILEELPIPFRVEVTHWESLRHEGLRRHISTCGVPWPGSPADPGAAAPLPAPVVPPGCTPRSAYCD